MKHVHGREAGRRKACKGLATRCDEMGRFPAILSF